MSKPRKYSCPECGRPALLLQRRERTHWTYIKGECERGSGCGKTSAWRIPRVQIGPSILALMM